ncbi:hypothetical protein KM043_006929 [Ampulex compressa]|nr:hypothetical protein KM043_006929 [Ampulex compressa]
MTQSANRGGIHVGKIRPSFVPLTFQIPAVFVIACLSTIGVRSDGTKSSQEVLLDRASAQLERLAPYRRLGHVPSSQEADPGEAESTRRLEAQRIGLEIFQILPDELRRNISKRIDEGDAESFTIDLLADPRYAAFMQERIKRSGSGSFVGGSSSIVSGIASGLIGGLASASGGASRGSSSSSQHKPEYGPAHPYEDKTFDVWDFKKAIFNTVVQAIKAISGGVIALKGQIIKGSGLLISTKGRIISTTGDAISSLGRQIAGSAVLHPPKYYGHPGYSYDHPPVENDGHDHAYEGHPPSLEGHPGSDNSGYSSYSSPSHDEDDHTGLLIVKPDSNDHHPDEDSRKPNLALLEESFGGPAHEYDKKVVPSTNEGSNNVDSHFPLEHPPPSFDSSNYYSYDSSGKQPQEYPAYPPLDTVHSTDQGNHLSIQQSVEYPPVHVNQIQYSMPHGPEASVDSAPNDLSLFSSVSIGVGQEHLKLPTIDAISGAEFVKLQPQLNLQAQPQVNLQSMHSFPGVYGHQGSPSLPVLQPRPAHYWQNRGVLPLGSNLEIQSLGESYPRSCRPPAVVYTYAYYPQVNGYRRHRFFGGYGL